MERFGSYISPVRPANRAARDKEPLEFALVREGFENFAGQPTGKIHRLLGPIVEAKADLVISNVFG
jgi:hypothetical protein